VEQEGNAIDRVRETIARLVNDEVPVCAPARNGVHLRQGTLGIDAVVAEAVSTLFRMPNEGARAPVSSIA
jgi:hypothetical protein